MVVTLEWVRDHYDVDKSRYIEKSEFDTAVQDYFKGLITREQFDKMRVVYDNHLLLPAYNGEHAVSFVLPRDATITVI